MVPLLFNFTGSVFYRGEDGRIQVAKVPWDSSARFELPVQTWRDMMAAHYPNGGWVAAGRRDHGGAGRAQGRPRAAHVRR